MALAEARAAWQRTANRCLVQEDAKRAPKLACCSSLPPSAKPTDDDMGPTNAPDGQEIPTVRSQPFNQNPSYAANLSPSSRWWLQLQPNYGYQKGLMNEQFNSPDSNVQMQESMDDPGLTDQTTYSESSYVNQCVNFRHCEKKDFGGEENVRESRDEGVFSSKSTNELCFDSEKHTPWWRNADTEELALLVAQRSLDVVENCDLPRPQNARFKKNLDVNMCYFGHGEVITPSLDSKTGIGGRAYVPGSANTRSSCKKLRMTAEAELHFGTNKPLRDDAGGAKLMEALRHSQTRAREAEKVARQAYAETQHVVKLVFRQASQLFAYKQWLHFLQLENMYFQFITDKTALPQRSGKTRKNWRKSSNRKRSRLWYDYGKYAVVLAFGLGLVGAGLLLGWTIGWMW